MSNHLAGASPNSKQQACRNLSAKCLLTVGRCASRTPCAGVPLNRSPAFAEATAGHADHFSPITGNQGLGAGVGRGLGVGSDLGVGVGLGVTVGVTLGVAVAVAVGVGVTVAVAVGVDVGLAVGVGVGVPPPVGNTRT